MRKLIAAVVLPCVALALAAGDLAPDARHRPAYPGAGVRAPALPDPTTDDPPPFGTVVQEWSIYMSGGWAGAGITWRQDVGRFYLADQHGGMLWSCDPFDPPVSLRQENFVMPNLGGDTADIFWSIAWDGDSGCFWISQTS